MSENSKFFYIYKSEFHFVKMAIKATNKSATTHHTILMSTVSMKCTKCHSNRIMLNEQHYYPQQLKRIFTRESISFVL